MIQINIQELGELHELPIQSRLAVYAQKTCLLTDASLSLGSVRVTGRAKTHVVARIRAIVVPMHVPDARIRRVVPVPRREQAHVVTNILIVVIRPKQVSA